MSGHRVRRTYGLRRGGPPDGEGGRSSPSDPRWPASPGRRGTEPATARSALRVRMILAALFAPIFLAGTGALWFWTTQTGPGDVPDRGSLWALTLVCLAVSVFAVLDLVVVIFRRRQARARARGG